MTEPRRRGRPVELDIARVSEVALDLFLEHGYDTVTMDDVARASGHSRRTVFRHFPTKSSLVWASADGFVDALRDHLAAVDPELPAMDAVREAYVRASAVPEEHWELTRRRLRLIGDNPALLADGVERFHGVDGIIARAVVDRAGVAHDSLVAAVVGGAVVLCAHNAAVWWARHGEGQPGEAIDTALRRLSAGFAAA